MSRHSQLDSLVRPVVEGLGYELWWVEFRSQGKKSLLRVTIDSPAGINVDDCASISRQLSAVLDVEDPIGTEYSLEVSSPGMDRELHELAHYRLCAGNDVRLRLRAPYEGQRKFQGMLKGVEDEDVVLIVDEHEYLLPLDLIEKANIVPRF